MHSFSVQGNNHYSTSVFSFALLRHLKRPTQCNLIYVNDVLSLNGEGSSGLCDTAHMIHTNSNFK